MSCDGLARVAVTETFSISATGSTAARRWRMPWSLQGNKHKEAADVWHPELIAEPASIETFPLMLSRPWPVFLRSDKVSHPYYLVAAASLMLGTFRARS
jgi:hypothetical protein